jgi:ribosomal protein L2
MEFTMAYKERTTMFIVGVDGTIVATRLLNGKFRSIHTTHNGTVGHVGEKCDVLKHFTNENFIIYAAISDD